MTAYTTSVRFAAATVLAALLVLGMVPAAFAQTAGGSGDNGTGWERTSTATGESTGQIPQAGGAEVSSYNRYGWERTSVATGAGLTGNDPVATSPQPASPSPTLLYVAAIVAAIAMTLVTMRLLRPRGRPTGVA